MEKSAEMVKKSWIPQFRNMLLLCKGASDLQVVMGFSPLKALSLLHAPQKQL